MALAIRRRALHVAVVATQRQVVDGAVATDFCVGRSAAHVPLTLHVVPLPSAAARQVFVPQSAVAVFVIDPLHGGPDAGGFARAYGLTPAEHRVLHEIIQGTAVVEAAAKIRVAVPTARNCSTYSKRRTPRAKQNLFGSSCCPRYNLSASANSFLPISAATPFFFDAAADAAGGTTRGHRDANARRGVANP